MEKVIAEIQEWNFLKTLPAQMHGFQLINELMQCGAQYRIFTYQNSVQHRSFSVLYDSATKDFLVRVVVGLTEYCDIAFITPQLERFEQLLTMNMEKNLLNLACYNKQCLDSIITAKKVAEWDYASELPQEIAGFQLFIRPQEPLKVLNGSYIILDYSDFVAESHLILYYNIYRDEFFGEMRIHRTPKMAGIFDSRELTELAEKLKTHLRSTLEEMRLQL